MMDLEGLKAWLPGRTTRLRPADRRPSQRNGSSRRALVVSELPLFPVTTVGSWPRPPKVAEALRAVSPAAHRPRRVRSRSPTPRWSTCCGCRTSLGCDIVTDGELRRDNFYSFVAEKLTGVRLMTLAEMLDVVEDKAGFERLLQTLDVPAYSISSPICTGTIARRRAAGRSTTRVRAAPHRSPGEGHAARALPPDAGDVRARGDAARSMPTRRRSPRTSSALLRAELAELAAAGADFVQFDEPVLTELAFAPGQHAHVHVRGAGGAPGSGGGARVRRVAHQPRGRRHSTACGSASTSAAATGAATKRRCSRGGYRPLAPYLERLNVTQLVLEYATDRAGDLMAFDGKELGLGVVNPRTDAVESTAADSRGRRRRASFLSGRPDVPESRLRIRHILEPADEYLGDGRGESRRDGRGGS